MVVGGTGMIRDVSVFLAGKGYDVTVVARNHQRLNSLVNDTPSAEGSVHPAQVDYHDGDAFLKEMERAISTYGPIQLAVVWIHSTAPEAPYKLASLLDQSIESCDYFHIIGSSVADPSRDSTSGIEGFHRFKNLRYHEVILGFILENDGSRWLTHQEISQGVIDAIHSNRTTSIVGVVKPWSKKP
ncbi:short-chain dehydrogenase [Melghirimyces profundicolus]|uniref:short-chain dehydrogenase n=1 Tax=Melghirimyces profundicolus TaxID=1242148 RepID=UPI002481CDE8|nr:short-chain dehydrogenase [Melghirimyces profundicolus]